MELRQLRYFVAVADALHFGRAAKRLHISGPALSQQIIALERDVGAQLFRRDRRGVALTPAGHTLLGDARQLLGLAEAARGRLRETATLAAPLRVGYVSWLPSDIAAVVGPTVTVQVDEWILPSHSQADRVAEGTLDLAVAWVTATDAHRRNLCADLLHAEPLHAMQSGSGTGSPTPASELVVLVDADESAWSSWNRFAEEFATDTGARTTAIQDGGIVGEAYHGHVRRAGRPVLLAPKRHTAPVPPSLGQRSIVPVPLWNWSLLHRSDDDRPSVRHVVSALLRQARNDGRTAPPADAWWVPLDDPYRSAFDSPS